MKIVLEDIEKIVVVGLGYVGLPLGVALGDLYQTIGYDINPERIQELQQYNDRTGEVASDILRKSQLKFTSNTRDIINADVYIVTVPTPVDKNNRPDLTAITDACNLIAPAMAEGAIVVFESTVYPGVTEEICAPIMEKKSGMASGKDFFLGYSPERINPGDKEHRIDQIVKVVAGQTPKVTQVLANMYGQVTAHDIHKCSDIRTAEAAKVIENAQRDINIAFVNEVAVICQNLGLSTYEVLEAAKTKWNFLPFSPGLVGGHCIGVDPYYLAFRAQESGYNPEIMIAGRRLNDSMGEFIAGRIDSFLTSPSRILLLGLTFKENVPDLRNSKIIDLMLGLERRNHVVKVHDPIADSVAAKKSYDIDLLSSPFDFAPYDVVVGAVAHDSYCKAPSHELISLLKRDGLLADVKNMWRHLKLPENIKRWSL